MKIVKPFLTLSIALLAVGFLASVQSLADEGPPDPISIDRGSPSIPLGGVNTPGDIYDMLPPPLSGMGWDVGGPGPIVHVFEGAYGLMPGDNNDAHSRGEQNPDVPQVLYFSGDDDRDLLPGDVSMGMVGTDYRDQAIRDQAAGDRFMVNGLTTLSPAAVMGGAGPSAIGPPIFPGGLGNFPTNLLSANQTRYNEIPSIGPGPLNTFVPPAGSTKQDDMDALELLPFDLNGDGMHETPIFFSLDAASPGMMGSPADIFVSPPVAPAYHIYAPAPSMGLTPADELDALAVWELNGDLVATPQLEYALFSLAPSSPTLWGPDGGPGRALVDDDGINGVDDPGEVGLGDDLSPADIFVTDFTGRYRLFLAARTIGMLRTDNVDAIDVELQIQAPLDMVVKCIPGDTDCDGDVDTLDLTTAIQNFTGAGGSGKTQFDGDTDGDGDVDTLDLTTAIGNFTGAMAATPNVPDLVYDPATGNVTIDADGADMISFSLQPGPFNPADFSDLPAGLTDNIAGQIGWTSFNLFTGLTGTADLGAILPAGLDEAGLLAALQVASYGLALSGGGGGGTFDIIIPEPASMVLMGLGVLLMVRRRAA